MPEGTARMEQQAFVRQAEPRPGSLEDLYVRHMPDAACLAFLLTRDRGFHRLAFADLVVLDPTVR